MQKSLLVLCGKLRADSALGQQLGIDDIFSLRLGPHTYRTILEERLSDARASYDVVWDTTLEGTELSVGKVRAFLFSQVPAWKTYRNVVMYPGALHFKDPALMRSILNKLALSDQPAATSDAPELCAFPASLIEILEIQDRSIRGLDHQITIEAGERSLDLSQSRGIFEVSRTSTAARHFNEFTEAGPYLVKRSRKTNKAKQEYTYLSQLPESVRAYFPAVGAYRENGETQEYEVEFVPMFDASRLLIHGALTPEVFELLLRRIDEYRSRCPVKKVNRAEYVAAMQSLFIDKLEARLVEFKAHPESKRVLEFARFIAPDELGSGLDGLVAQLTKRLAEKIKSVDGDSLSFSHGDLCLANILFDHRSGYLKLIDPRGMNRLDDAYLPWYYDLAKLSHSILGCYDLIINGLASVEVDKKLNLHMKLGANNDGTGALAQVFKSWVRHNKWDYELLRLCEASLFLSMLPLHMDKPDSVIQHIMAGARSLRDASA